MAPEDVRAGAKLFDAESLSGEGGDSQELLGRIRDIVGY
jgi:hypothetical protein